MKKTILTLLFLLFVPTFVFAAGEIEDEDTQNPAVEQEESITEETIQVDENTTKVTNKYFDLTLERKPQSAFGKHIPYILTVTPHLNSSRTQILWNTPSTLEASAKHKEYVSMNEGETYTFSANVKPLREGTFDFSVSVISWQHDTNYTNSIADTITISRNLVLQPVSSEYTLWNIIKVLGILVLFGVLCYLTIVIVKKYMVKAKKWLTPPY